MSSFDLFIVHCPLTVVNEGGYIESYEAMQDIIALQRQRRNSKRNLLDANSSACTTSVSSSICEMNDTIQHDPEEVKPIEFHDMLNSILVDDLAVKEPKWTSMMDGKSLEVKFCIAKEKTEHILNSLISLGIGDRFGTIWITPLDVNRPKPRVEHSSDNLKPDHQFTETIKSRMIVEKVVEAARASAAFSFDYVSLVVVASSLASIGLAYNNVVVIVASMLVSPIMGPVVAVTFGTVIQDRQLRHMGLWSEIVSLVICVFIGFLHGLLMVPFSKDLDWPTSEMLGRGSLSGLISGVLVAIPSGIGVALSILGNNTSSLVGVAISASLLPPAVNTGVLLAIASLSNFYHPDNMTGSDLAKDSIVQATFSFLITLANIVVIYLMALGMFKVKEVAPIPGKTRFWKDDVKMTREYNGVLKGEEAQDYAEKIRKMVPTLREDPEIQEITQMHNERTLDHYISMHSMRSDASDDYGNASGNRASPSVSSGKPPLKHRGSGADLMSLFVAPSTRNLNSRGNRGISAPPRYYRQGSSTASSPVMLDSTPENRIASFDHPSSNDSAFMSQHVKFSSIPNLHSSFSYNESRNAPPIPFTRKTSTVEEGNEADE